LVFRDEPLLMAEVSRDDFRAAAEIIEVAWFAGDFEVAGAGEIAGHISRAD